jgi:hypothetical protein
VAVIVIVVVPVVVGTVAHVIGSGDGGVVSAVKVTRATPMPSYVVRDGILVENELS